MKYGTALGLHTTWRFFSPNPLIKVLEYHVIGSKTESEDVRHRFPASPKESKNRESFGRLMNYAIFVGSRPDTLEAHLHPVLCKKWPDAAAIEYDILGKEFPAVEKAQGLDVDRKTLMVDVRTPAGEFECPH